VWSNDSDGDYELYMQAFPIDPNVPPTKLTDNDTDDIGAQFSNDGTMLAWLQRNEFGVYDLMLRNLVTGEEEKLVNLGANVNLNAWAPSDRFIAWDSNVDGDFDVFAVEIEENEDGEHNIKNVTNNLFQDRAPSFRCNSDIIIYQSDSPGQFDIFQIDPDPIDPNGPFNVPENLTRYEPATDIYAMNQPLDEDGSREGRLPQTPR
jgi:Tol biopolymer transport system component